MLRAYVSPYKVEDDEDEDRGLDQVGRLAVLGAMVEQRKRSSLLPIHEAPVPSEPASPDESGTHPRQRQPSAVDPVDLLDVFQKIR